MPYAEPTEKSGTFKFAMSRPRRLWLQPTGNSQGTLRLALEFQVQAQPIWLQGFTTQNLTIRQLLALTGLVPRHLIGSGSMQEIDQYAFFEPICVFNSVLMSERANHVRLPLWPLRCTSNQGVAHVGIPNRRAETAL